MNPTFLDDMSWEMAEVYGAVSDQILINLAHYFPWYDESKLPRSTFAYQADMLAQMGKVSRDAVNIIHRNLDGADQALRDILEQAIIDSIRATNPPLLDAAKRGILQPAGVPIVAPNQMRAYSLYYKQAADKLNLVNTVMLESTQQAYAATVTDVVARVQATQTALDIGAGEAITGVSSWNQATQHAIRRMADRGITGFIDHGGHRWSAEGYVAMDIRTTVANTARAAVWETNENFGNDLYSVSYHNGARPLCYPWQNKVISATDQARTVTDLDGNEITVYAQSDTTYGEAAGLFGINCKHYPTPFIPGVSLIRGEPQDKEANDLAYEQSQEQRRLERKLREDRRDLMMMKARGVPEEQIRAQQAKCDKSSQDIEDFCDSTGRARRRNREGVYTKRSFPAADTYDVTAFERTQQEQLREYFANGGAQQGYTFGTLVPNAPTTPAQSVTPVTQAKGFNYGEPFNTEGYRAPQVRQFESAKTALDNAPEVARNVWEKCADKMTRPLLDTSCDGAYYSPVKRHTYYKTWEKCFGESTYQRSNVVFFHEHGHFIDHILGGGTGYAHSGCYSVKYVGRNGKTFAQMLEDEIHETLSAYYLKDHGLADAYDAVKEVQNGAGGMGFTHYIRQMLRGVMPRDEYNAIRDMLFDAGDDDSVLRPLADKWLGDNLKSEFRDIVRQSKNNATRFNAWVKKTYSIYQRADVSDAFGNYMTRTYGHGYNTPFDVGHAYSYQMNASNLPIETFAEMYSATVANSDSLDCIRDFFPKSYDFFLEMLGSVE